MLPHRLGLPTFLVVALAVSTTPAVAGQYFQDFSSSAVGATNFSDGSTLFGNQLGTVTEVVDPTYKELQLTLNGSNNTQAAYLLPDLDPGRSITRFSARFNLVVLGGFPNAADGFSFSFGPLRATNFMNGAQEHGFGTGLCFSVVTYPLGGHGLFVKVQTNVIASVTNIPPGFLWGTNSTERKVVTLDWSFENGLSVSIGGVQYFANAAAGSYTPEAGDSFVVAARTGSQSEYVRIDNLVVLTGANLARVVTMAPYFGSQTNAGNEADKAFDGISNTIFGAFGTSGFAGATLATTKIVRAYSISTFAAPASDPKTWTFEGSNDGTNWSVCGSGSGYFINSFETRFWPATNAAAFSKYRLNVSDNASGSGNLLLDDIGIYEQTNALFEPVASGLPPASLGGAAWGDYNNDGWLDFAIAGQNAQPTQVWRNEGNGKFTLALQPAINVSFLGDVQWADFNNDGYLDLLVVGDQDSKLFQNQAGTNFTAVGIAGLGAVNKSACDWGDYDNDGRPDFAIVGDGTFQLWHNDGNSSFSQVPIPSLSPPPGLGTPSQDPVNGYEFTATDKKDVKWIDYDRDGRLDFVFGGGRRFELWHNDGGSFSQDLSSGLPMANTNGFFVLGLSLSVGDYNGDGWEDILYASDGERRLFRNDGAGNFIDASTGDWTTQNWDLYLSAAFADVDGDGHLDLTGTDYAYLDDVAEHLIMLNTSGGFSTLSPLPLFNNFAVHPSLSWGDFDRDGRQDLLYDSGTYPLWRNTFSASNTPPTAPSSLSSDVAGHAVTLAWNKATDAATSSTGLSYNVRIGTGPGLGNVLQASASTSGLRRLAAAGNAGLRTNALFRLPPATYYWSVQALDNSWAGSAFAAEQSFTVSPYAPSLLTNFYRNLKPHGVDVVAQADVGASAVVGCQYGTSVSYGASATAQLFTNSSSATATFKLRTLEPATVYHARTFVTNALGVSYGSDLVFTTLVDNSGVDIVLPSDAQIPFAGSYGGNQEASQAIDNHVDTRMLAFTTVNAGYDITPSGNSIVRGITVFAAFDSPRDPAGWMLEGSMDGINFTFIASNAIPAYTQYYQPQMFPIVGSVAYDTYRVTLTHAQSPGEVIHCGDIELLAYFDITSTGDSTAVTLPPGASVVNGAAALLNRQVVGSGDKFEVVTMSNTVAVDIVPVSGRSIFKGFETIGANDDGSFPGRTPTNIAVYGSNDGTNFTPLVTGTLVSPSTRHIIQEFKCFTNTTPYTRYRAVFGRPLSGDHLQVGELRLFGVPVAGAIDAWRFNYFETTNNTGTAANTNDADGDGHANLFEYGTGGDPLVADSSSALGLTVTNNARIYFTRNPAATDATLYAEAAVALTNGATWTGLATNRNGSWGTATNVTEGGGNPVAVSVTDPSPGTNRFLRLRVTHP